MVNAESMCLLRQRPLPGGAPENLRVGFPVGSRVRERMVFYGCGLVWLFHDHTVRCDPYVQIGITLFKFDFIP